MKIESLYTNYTQKSKLFLYPLLDIKRGVSVTAIATFMGWENKYCFTDSKLICQYHLREDTDFRLFEDVKLLGSPLFHALYELEDGTGAYIFDFADYEKDFWKVVQGRYSELSGKAKTKILNHYCNHSKRIYVESYLRPKKFYPLYSEILNVEVKTLKEVGELCSKPDLEKEKLDLSIKIMNISDNPLNLQQ